MLLLRKIAKQNKLNTLTTITTIKTMKVKIFLIVVNIRKSINNLISSFKKVHGAKVIITIIFLFNTFISNFFKLPYQYINLV